MRWTLLLAQVMNRGVFLNKNRPVSLRPSLYVLRSSSYSVFLNSSNSRNSDVAITVAFLRGRAFVKGFLSETNHPL